MCHDPIFLPRRNVRPGEGGTHSSVYIEAPLSHNVYIFNSDRNIVVREIINEIGISVVFETLQGLAIKKK